MRNIILLLGVLLLFSCERGSNIIPDPPYEYSYSDYYPAWSNDGEKLTFFSSGIKQLSDSTIGLYVMNSDGTDKILISEINGHNYTNPVWLRGDSEIVYSSGGIFKININSKEILQLIDAQSDFDISPDGRNIYYSISSDSINCGHLILHNNLQSGIIDTVTCGLYPSLSPDLQFIAYYRKGIIHYCDLESYSETTLNLEGSSPDWSPSGDLIVYVSVIRGFYHGIYATDLSGNNYKIVGSGLLPDVSPDGSKIVYQDLSHHLWLVNIDGTDNTQLTF